VRQPVLLRSWLAPSYASPGHEHSYAMELLAEILGGGGTSRLFRAVVVERALAAGAGCFVHGTGLDGATFRVYASPRPDVPMAEIEGAVAEEIAKVLAEGVTEQELVRTRQRLIAEAIYARDSLGGAARVFGSALTSGESVGDVEAWPTRIAAVTLDQVHTAARQVFRPEQSVTALLLPAEAA
jgi:zinc protease